MNKLYLILILFSGVWQLGMANEKIDSLENLLCNNRQVQEKIYIHTNNNSYFAGDTIWYKAYVLRADNLRPTHLSKLLYVELLTPDGFLVERQRIVIDNDTQSHGQFCLPDTIYSGYYELRAYTRWQLNFNSFVKEHIKWPDAEFVNDEFEDNFYRDYDGLYSRVFPIYDKPKKAGSYNDRYISGRPKRRQPKEKEGIEVHFYPESGTMLVGTPCKVAYEVLRANGEPLQTVGHLDDGTPMKTDADGRGIITVESNDTISMMAHFDYQGKTYDFVLPQFADTGAVINYSPEIQQVRVHARCVSIGAVSVTCRGQVVSFSMDSAVVIDTRNLPTGVNEIVVYDEEARPLAARQFFVNHNDLAQRLQVDVRNDVGRVQKIPFDAQPFQPIQLQFAPGDGEVKTFSISVCDQLGDGPVYDDCSILTDLLLAGDLRGFVAHPAYYFEADDAEHRAKLDQLMMIQGWRKYRVETNLRHRPEKTLSIEGCVLPAKELYMENDLKVYLFDNSKDKHNPCCPCVWNPKLKRLTLPPLKPISTKDVSKLTYLSQVLVEAELNLGTNTASVVSESDPRGRFYIQVPPFYGKATLRMCAYRRCDSAYYCMSSKVDKYKYNMGVTPYFEVRCQPFFPLWVKPYTWQQIHDGPDDFEKMDKGPLPDISGADHLLSNVTVKRKRRDSLHRFDKRKPAFSWDFLDLYNVAYDQGLPNRTFNALKYYIDADFIMFGDMNIPSDYRLHTSVSINGHYFIKPLNSDLTAAGEPMTPDLLRHALNPRNIGQIKVYTDYDKRTGIGEMDEDE